MTKNIFCNYNCIDRGKQRLIGIKNQGATCYLNSLIQTLYLTPEFRDSLFNLGRDELGSISGEKDSSNNDVQVCFSYVLSTGSV